MSLNKTPGRTGTKLHVQELVNMTKQKGTLGKLKRLPTFTVSDGEVQFSLKTVDPMFRFSLTRLIESQSPPSPGEEPRFGRQFQLQCQRIRDAVHSVCQFKKEEKKSYSQAAAVLDKGQLSALHNDIRILLRSQAGTFIFEYYQNTLLPGAVSQLLDVMEGGVTLIEIWTHFYCTVLPTLDAIFIQVKNQKMTIRQVTLLAFRDHVLLKLEPTVLETYTSGKVDPAVRQMLLVVQSVVECYPPSEKRLTLESHVCRAVSPYLGHRGLYENGNSEPVVKSRELDVAHLRRPSVEDPRRLLRPLSVNTSSHYLETLSDLFELSANRAVQKHT
ncbi:hypothetical protein L9F63_015899 [Diploptera punctata]|uniref:Uncharacterized protein n=1 Tax=Diploptera punctata TaxID=6984 RepID=A0AAD8EJG2_DIPPU|nr:hypothetical protein L9F63_015899 [Diploptera punctata]